MIQQLVESIHWQLYVSIRGDISVQALGLSSIVQVLERVTVTRGQESSTSRPGSSAEHQHSSNPQVKVNLTVPILPPPVE